MKNYTKIISKILEKRILVLDGAMGTMIQRYNFSEEDYRGDRFKDYKHLLKGNNDLLSLTQPKAIKEIHESFLDAGADIIETNTFSSTTVAMADYHMENMVYELNFESARIAVDACKKYTDLNLEKPRFVAGSIGPTNKTASMSPDVNDPAFRAINFDELVISYSEQIEALIQGGVHILLVETIFDTLNAKAALFAISGVFEKIGYELPIMVSGTITDASGRTLSGQTTEAFITSLSHLPLLTIGFNCALGADLMLPYMKRVSRFSNFYTAAFPNAGLPNAFGEYDESSSQMGEKIKFFLDEGCVNIIGGCCGTTPDHIKVINELVKNYKPRKK